MSKRHFSFRIAAGLFSGLALQLAAGAAIAASPTIEAAKDACVIGEQADGYLGVVTGETPSDALRREVRDVNQKRRATYADLAARNGVTIEVTAMLTAEKLIGDAERGECVRMPDGKWKRV